MSHVTRRSIAGLAARYDDDPVVTAILEELVRLQDLSDLAEQQLRKAVQQLADQEDRIGRATRRISVFNVIEEWLIKELSQRDRALFEAMRFGLEEYLRQIPVDDAQVARVASRWCA